MYELSGKRLWVAGHGGMVGSALLRKLQLENCTIITAPRQALDLRRQTDVETWMEEQKPQAIILAAARVGGIVANSTWPADFLGDNVSIAANVIRAAAAVGVEKLLYLGSSCIYPKLAEQPIREDQLLTGPLEPTNQWYAVAKIAGLMLARAYRRQHGCDFISAMPTNLYGPGDNFDLTSSHVIPALMRKAHEAKTEGKAELMVWGSGTPRREFLHVDDAADALVHIMRHYSADEHINIGCGGDVTIKELAASVAEAVGFEGNITTDPSKPDGTPRKLLDVSKLKRLGWQPRIELKAGLADTYRWYLDNVAMARRADRGAPSQLISERAE